MKLIFFIPVWKRPEITEICFMGINRLRESGIHQIEAFAVISEEEMKPLCDQYGIEYCFYKNLPLGEKKNFGVSQLLKKDFDYMVEIGSDDLLKNEFLNLYPWDGPILSLRDFIIINSETGACRRLSAKVTKNGLGRAISKEALSSGKVWTDGKNRGMDGNSLFNLGIRGFLEKSFPSEEPLAIDIKSKENLWPYSKIGEKYPIEKALAGLSDEETNAITCLTSNKTSENLISV